MRITLYGWLQYDPTLFDDVTLPSNFDKQYMIDEIIMRSGDLFTYNQEPTHLKRNISNWFNRNFEQFKRMMDALLAEYNPIENYDRTEDTLTTPGVERTEEHTGKDGRNIKSYPTAIREEETKVSAYDSSTYSPKDKTIATGRGFDESQDDFTHGETIKNKVNGYDTFHSRVHGNIGVTTNAQMVTQEMELRKFDIYTDIARRFEKEFLIQIY